MNALCRAVQCVGASLLAKGVNDNAGILNTRGVMAFFASKLAPTKGGAIASRAAALAVRAR
ncbi:hypothetical protein CEC48_01405 [Pseudomonas sp. K2I15]|nr:hypothetical protein CEC48_01405 [Pseudomonas sp. K2I15]